MVPPDAFTTIPAGLGGVTCAAAGFDTAPAAKPAAAAPINSSRRLKLRIVLMAPSLQNWSRAAAAALRDRRRVESKVAASLHDMQLPIRDARQDFAAVRPDHDVLLGIHQALDALDLRFGSLRHAGFQH